MVWPKQFCKHIIWFRGQQITACEPDPATPIHLLIVYSCFPITDTTWPIKPEIFALWFFTESLLTLDSSSSILSPVQRPLKPLQGIWEVKAIFTLILTSHRPFHWVDICTERTKATLGKAASALAQIKTKCTLHCFLYHYMFVGNKTKSQFHLTQVGTIGILSQITVGFEGAVLCTVGCSAASPAFAQ